MSASSSLPVEIWQKILRYSISVPDFLDPDAFEGVLSSFALTDARCDRNNEATYWRVERHRNALKRVCMSWERYMRLFEHRFVRMADIWCQKLPLSVLTSAVRLCFAEYECNCYPSCNPRFNQQEYGYGVQSGSPHGDTPWSDIVWTLDADVPLERLDIVDLSTNQPSRRQFLALAAVAKRTKTILVRDYRHPRGVAYNLNVINLFPELRQFYGTGFYWGYIIKPSATKLIASTVTTLSLIKLSHVRRTSGTFKWDLPLLRHLEVHHACHAQKQEVEDDVYPLLHAVGKGLCTLYLINDVLMHDMPAEIWDWCPKLEKLATTSNLVTPPPASHPLNTYVYDPRHRLNQFDFLDWPTLRTITVAWIWDDTHTEDLMPSELKRVYVHNYIRIEDQNGTTWKEYAEKLSRVSSGSAL